MTTRQVHRLVVGMMMLLLTTIGLPVGTGGAVGAGGAVATSRGAAPQETLRILHTTTFVPANGTFTFTVDTSRLRLTDELAWTVHSLVTNNTDAVREALNVEPGPPLRAEQRATIGALDAMGSGSTTPRTPGQQAIDETTVAIPVRATSTGGDRVFLPDTGIYPVSVRVLRDGNVLDESTIPLVRLSQKPTSRQRLVHLVGTVEASPVLQVDGTIKASPADLATLAALTDQLSGLPGDGEGIDPNGTEPPMSVSMPAELVDDLARSDSATDTQAVSALTKVADRVTWSSSPYVSLDLGAWAAADVAQNPALTLSYDTAAGRLAGVLGVEVAIGLVPTDSTMAAPTVGFLADRGATGILVKPAGSASNSLPSTAFSMVGTSAPESARPPRQIELTTDSDAPTTRRSLPALTMTEFDASVLDEVPSDAAVVARELAILSADPLNSPTPANGSATPVDTSPFDVVALRVPPLLDGQQIANLVESLNSADGVLAPTGVSGVAAALNQQLQAPQTNRDVVLRPASSLGLGALEPATYRAQQAINAANSLVADDPGLSSAQRQVLIAPNRRLSVERAQAYAQSARGAAQDILDAVTLRDVSTITLAARKTKVPFRFRNQLQQPVTVSLRIRSDRLRLSDAGPDDRLDLVLPPGQSTSEVSVEVLTSGVFAVTADVMTSSGNEVLQRQEFQVRSRAFSGVGVALSAASLLVLGMWWLRTALAKRREATK
ncbi:MAG: DUF6049 family protein [Candidatus Microthrix parvicella]